VSAAEKMETRGRLGEADRRHILLDAAEAVFLREGYAAANMDEIARNAGMSKRTLYQHFSSKAELFEAVMTAALAPLRIDSALVEDEPDIARALAGMLAACTRHLLAARQCELIRLVISEVHRSPELADAFHRAGPGRGADSLETRIAREARQGRLRVNDPHKAAEMLYGMALGAAHMKVLLGLREPPGEAEIVQHINEAVTAFLHGALAEAPADA